MPDIDYRKIFIGCLLSSAIGALISAFIIISALGFFAEEALETVLVKINNLAIKCTPEQQPGGIYLMIGETKHYCSIRETLESDFFNEESQA